MSDAVDPVESMPVQIHNLRRELAEARELLRQCLKVMPCGYIPTHTIENLPKMISDLATELAEETAHHETLEGMYHKVVSACLRCDPIPACEREDDELEPPWEVIDRVKRQRDTLADALNGIIVDCSYDLPSWRVEESKEALAAVKGEEPEDPHKYCRGGGGNNFHCGCKYDAQNHESFYP